MLKLYKFNDSIVAANSKANAASYLNVSQSKIIVLTESDNINSETTIVDNIEYQDKKNQRLQSLIDRSHFINEPNHSLEIGQLLTVGNLENQIIVAIEHNRKIIQTQYNIPFVMEVFKLGNSEIELKSNNIGFNYLPWHEVFITEVKATDTLFIKDHLELRFNGMTIESIIHKNYFTGIDKDPEYQRGLVWTVEDNILLIESIFNQLDIGKFVLVEKKFDPIEPGYEVLDGKQRLNAIIAFIENRYKYKGFYYSELLPSDRRKFMNTPVALAIVQERKLSRENLINYFIKLNTAGKPVDPKFLDNLKKTI